MSATLYFKAQAYNNASANHRLLAACGQLTPFELAAKRVAFFPSIIYTLNHILIVDWFYVSGLEGDCLGPAAWDPVTPCTDFADLEREQRAVDKRLIDFCEALTDDGLGKEVELLRDGWVQRERADRVLLHLLQHQIHHRGQVHTMLSDTNIPPPQLDEFFLGHAYEVGLRSRDFEALGFEEDQIWKGLD